ncbi:MAG: hypothetical protein ACU837_11325 [Gammaproteobacteria bacterium]
MTRYANLYDICDTPILKEPPQSEAGENLKLLYRKSACHWLLKYLILKGCRHPLIPLSEVPVYRSVIRAGMQASYENWRDSDWIRQTFKPVAVLLDRIVEPHYRQRQPAATNSAMPCREQLHTVTELCMQDIVRIWKRDAQNPYFPVAAQVMLSGDEQMDGENFLSVLCGVGAFEYQNATLLFALLRCFITANPAKLRFIRRPYRGIAETMFQRLCWIKHRTAFYDVNFFEHLLAKATKTRTTSDELRQIVQIMENLLRFCVVSSREWLTTPNNGIQHPAITCLPLSQDGAFLFRLSDKHRTIKSDLGFGDYAPDTDTTFFTLSIAKKWLDFVQDKRVEADAELLAECRQLLAHPWVEIIAEYQVGGAYASNPPTIQFTKPLDYRGAVPIWFDKAFPKPDGRVIRNVVGNEICPGHNMDILEAILVNRRQWNALAGENLKIVRQLLDFHYRAFRSGNFKRESAFQYYLPEIYVYYTGRVYDVYLTLSDAEKDVLDPLRQIEAMRRIALDYCKNDLVAYTLNAFDAALALSALALLRYESKDDGVFATALQAITASLGEGVKGHPFLPYEWNRMRHPCRIIVGSDVATSLFVLHAAVNTGYYLYQG